MDATYGSRPALPAIHHLFEAHLTTDDPDRAIAFYRDVLGLELAYVASNGAAFFWTGGRGRAMLGIWPSGPGPQKLTMHVAFAAAVDEVVAAPASLRAAGVTPLDFDGRPADDAVVLAWMPAVSVYFRDPDGHLLEYIAMLPGEPRPNDGVVAWRDWRLAHGL